jgi:WD40 repeat protein
VESPTDDESTSDPPPNLDRDSPKDRYMFERRFFGKDWFSGTGPEIARERIESVARHLSRGVGQLIVWGTVVAGLAAIGSAALTRSAVESTDSAPIRGRALQTIESVAVSPDGASLAACGCNDMVRVWDIRRLTDGPAVEPVLLAHNSERHAVAFSPDGALLGAAGSDSVAIWSCKAGQFKTLFDRETETSRCLTFSPDGRTLALGMDDGSIRLWEMPSGHERALIPAHNAVVRSIAFSADSQRVVSTAQDATIMLSDAVNGICIHSLEPNPTPLYPVLFVTFAPDGQTVAVGEVSGDPVDVTLRDSDSGKIVMRFTGHNSGVHALAFSPDGRILATAGIDSSIKLWDVKTGKEITAFPGGDTLVKAIAFSPDGAWLAFGAGETAVRIRHIGHERSFVLGRPEGPA